MGRRRRPDELKRLEGNPGGRPLNSSAPKAEGRPECPEHLDSHARAVWARVVRSMPPALYAAADSDLLAAYCQACVTHRRAVEALEAEGAVIVSANGVPYQNPWVGIQNRQAQLMASIGSRLGLDPVARSSLSVPEQNEAPSRFQGLIPINGGKSDEGDEQ